MDVVVVVVTAVVVIAVAVTATATGMAEDATLAQTRPALSSPTVP
jgi:hypothetical protein